MSSPPARPAWRGLPASVWALGFGSLFMDASSELVHSVLPLFLVTSLGTSMAIVGLVEGVAEAIASLVKVFSGAVSDLVRRRKALLVTGYALSALTKPLFPLATSVGWVAVARFSDRVGKGIRGAPRDALVADLVEPDRRGAAYGLRQALDSVGAVIGPALALWLLVVFSGDLRAVMWFAVVPALVTVAVLVIFVREPEPPRHESARPRVVWHDARHLPRTYWLVVALGAVLTLARFSEAFLVLRATDVGAPMSTAPAVMIVMSLFYAAAAYPAGVAADRAGVRSLLVLGLSLLVMADVLLAFASSLPLVLVGAACWGLHMGATQGLLSKLVANAVGRDVVGTAFGVFNLVTGVALLAASVIAGQLWTSFGASATFLAGAVFASVAAVGLIAVKRAH
jgi:MFS family permease